MGLLVSAVTVPVFIAEGSLHIHNRIAPDSRAADYLALQNGATCQPVALTAADGVELRAWFFRHTEFNGGAVLLMHGVGDTRLGVAGHLQCLLRSGYAALMPDARGHGSSGGDLVTYGLTEARDAAMWAQWLRGQPGVERIYGLGESMGAGVLIQSLAYHPEFRAIVAECPFSTFEEIAEYRVGTLLVPLVARPIVSIASWYSQLRYGVDVMQASPIMVVTSRLTSTLASSAAIVKTASSERPSRGTSSARLKSKYLPRRTTPVTIAPLRSASASKRPIVDAQVNCRWRACSNFLCNSTNGGWPRCSRSFQRAATTLEKARGRLHAPPSPL